MQSRSIRTMLFRSSRTLWFGFLICMKIYQWRSSGGTFSRKCGLCFVSVEHTLGFLGLQTVCLNKVSPFSARHIGDSCGIRWQWTFVDTNMHTHWPSGLSCNRSRLVPNSGPWYLLTLLLWLIFQFYACLSSSLPEAGPEMLKLSPSPSESNSQSHALTLPHSVFLRTLRNTWNTLSYLLMQVWFPSGRCMVRGQDPSHHGIPSVWHTSGAKETLGPELLAHFINTIRGQYQMILKGVLIVSVFGFKQ